MDTVEAGPGDHPDASPPAVPKDPIVLAAQRMVVEVFGLAAAQMPELLKAQSTSPAGPEIQAFTEAMLTQLQAQVTRALGVAPATPPGDAS
ncbi:hypothetical protein GVN18_40760 [Pseudomonas sp. ODNR1LW]|nr:hypothetical protein [Pseudomonas sp. ODNR1LW]